jgi:hypothetical protein
VDPEISGKGVKTKLHPTSSLLEVVAIETMASMAEAALYKFVPKKTGRAEVPESLIDRHREKLEVVEIAGYLEYPTYIVANDRKELKGLVSYVFLMPLPQGSHKDPWENCFNR